ncbi:hypothetical protein [Halodurantibacterium flavum]|uniref:ATP-grasp domain-containing protein n=1 Tax=Halodurantibacterium flavum TaxID=1382802 RepID=A0ABW4S8I6_9RHOB
MTKRHDPRHTASQSTPAFAAPATGSLPAKGLHVHDGMPRLDPAPRYPWFKRNLSDPFFYLVPGLMWLALALRHGSLSLPSAANPGMEAGGLWGESKSQGLELFGPGGQRHLAAYVRLERGNDSGEAASGRALAAMAVAGLAFPVVGKPDRGYQGWGVRKLMDDRDLRDYLIPARPELTLLLQKLIDWQGEAGIFYIRHPDEAQGRIASFALNYAPHVVGDGQGRVADLVRADPVLRQNAEIYRARNRGRWQAVPDKGEVVILTNARSARLGAVYRDAAHMVTPELEACIDNIAREIPGFHFGRFDIRFRSIGALLQGRDFCIVELNGAGAEMLHLWDGRKSTLEAYRTLWGQYRALFSIGAEMRRQGHHPTGLRELLRLQRRQEKLRRSYPPTS